MACRVGRGTPQGGRGSVRRDVMAKFKALVVTKAEQGQSVAAQDFDEADLMDGDVTVRVTHSTVNYKDGLALTGKAPVVRRFPMIPGIDFAGIVEASSHADFKAGDNVAYLQRLASAKANAGSAAIKPDGSVDPAAKGAAAKANASLPQPTYQLGRLPPHAD